MNDYRIVRIEMIELTDSDDGRYLLIATNARGDTFADFQENEQTATEQIVAYFGLGH